MRGAREHNLKDVTVAFPRDRLVVITGLSGSGKSSLAFDTIYAEGQRRYVESLAAYARQFLGQMEKPDVDQIDGLSPGHLDRPEGREPQPAFDGRDRHRDLRPPAPAVRADRHPALPRRPRDRAPERPADRRPGARPAGGHPPARPRPADQGPQDGGRPHRRRRPASGVRARPGRRGAVRHRRRPQARQVQAPLDRGRGRPLRRPPRRGAGGRDARRRRSADRPGDRPGHPGSGRVAAGRLDRDGPAARRGCRARSPRRRATARRRTSRSGATARSTAVPYDGFTIDELEPRSFSFNSPHGACPSCAGLGTKLEIDPGAAHPATGEEPRRGRARDRRPAVHRRVVADEDHRGRLRGPRLGLRGAGPQAAEGGARLPALRGEGPGASPRALPPRTRREHLQGQLRGHRHQPRAPLPRVRVGLHQGRDREVHGHQALPDLWRQAAPAGDPRRDDRRPGHLGRLDDVDQGRPALGERPARRR